MNNKQVAHIWANQSRPSANGSHFYFSGDTVYSYGEHFPIARHYKGAVLFTNASYSNSTTRHKSITRSACSHLTVFRVEDVTRKPSGKDVKHYQDRLSALRDSVATMRAPSYWDLEQVLSLTSEAREFCKRFGFSTKFENPCEKWLAAVRVKINAAKAKKAEKQAAANARQEAELAEKLPAWLAGEIHSLPHAGSIHLRAFNGEMQTSRGAHVPLADAQRAFRFVTLKRATGWHRNGDCFPVGDFQLDSVSETGVKAGCHDVTWSEIERFAASQNWKA